MGDTPLAVALQTHDLLRAREHLLGLLGETVLSHHGAFLLPHVRGDFRVGVSTVLDWLASRLALAINGGGGQACLSKSLELLAGLVELGLEDPELVVHTQDDFDPGEIDAEFLNEALGLADALDVGVGVHPDITAGAVGLDEARALVVTQRLLMQPHQARRDRDHVNRARRRRGEGRLGLAVVSA